MVTITANNDGPIFVNETEGAGDVDGNVLGNDLLDGIAFTGNVVEVNGSPTGVGNWIDGSNGGRVKISDDGGFDFDAAGDFSQLVGGGTATVSFRYTISSQNSVTPQKTNVVFVIDQSGSTRDDFLNAQDLQLSNSTALTKLNAEMLSVQNLMSRIDKLGIPSDKIDISLVFFSDMATSHGPYKPSQDLSGLFVDIVPLSGTNYDAGLSNAGTQFSKLGASKNDNNIVFFLSDGKPNSGEEGKATAKTLMSDYNAQIVAVGVGDNVTKENLDPLDNTGGSEIIKDVQSLDDSLFTGLIQTINITDSATLSIEVNGLGNSISGTYFLDQDYNGQFNGADSTVSGKTVSLMDANSQVIATKTTNPNGFYIFDNLLQGNYRIKFEDSRPFEDFIASSGTTSSGSDVVDLVAGTTGLISLDQGVDVGNVNAGVAVQTGGLFGTVFEDLNSNNIYDGSDQPIAGVGVELLDAQGNPTDSTTVTDGKGNFSFIGMIPASYDVIFTNPANKVLVSSNVGSDDTIDSDAVSSGAGISSITGVSITAGSNTNFNDAGFRDLNSQISNISLNTTSGALTFGDPISFKVDYSIDPLGTPVQIIATPLDGGTPLTQDATILGFNPGSSGTANGTLSVSNAGNIFATVDGIEVKLVEAGNPSKVLSTSTIGANFTFDAGNLGIFGNVFTDLDGNGQDNNEPGRGGIQIDLLDGTGTTIATTTSNQAQGDFSFGGLNSGQYQLRFPITDSGLVLSSQTSGGFSPNPSSGLTGSIALDPFTSRNFDAGYSDPKNGSISGRAFEDLNGNSVFDTSDAGIAGLSVELLNASDGSLVSQTNTGSSGAYIFSALPSGTYVVKFQSDAGFSRAPVSRDSGASDNNDSDINQTTGQTGSIVLSPSGSAQNVDAGYAAPSAGPAQIVDLTSGAQFTYWGDAQDARSGWAVAGIGDINNDGTNDFAISAHWESTTATQAGKVYVVFGGNGLPSASSLGLATRSDGFTISGSTPNGLLGEALSPAGDFNGDGFDDFIVGAPGDNAAHVIYGQSGANRPDTDIGSLGTGGVTFIDPTPSSAFGSAVASAGDLNNDGFDDILFGAWGSSEAYLIYGKAGGYTGTVSIPSLSANDVTKFTGGSGENAGVSLHGIADFNNDGFDDLAIGAETASRNGKNDVGVTYVIYGAAASLPTLIDLTTDSDLEFVGANAGDLAGHSVQGGFDFNSDGISDLMIGAPNADPNNLSDAGTAYVIYGGSNQGSGVANLDQILGSAGMIINGVSAGANFGGAVASAGDFNNDTISDIIIGAENFSEGNSFGAGRSYVLFGQGGTPLNPSLNNLKLDEGIIFDGAGTFNYSGKAVARLGDVNNDGKDDIAIGAHLATINGVPRAGIVHIVSDNQPPPGLNAQISVVNTPFATSGIFAQGNGRNNETFVTGTGNDTIETGAGDDQVASGGGNDILLDNNGDDVLDADAGNDILISLAGQNQLFGGAGSDILIGGFGADNLDGGVGDDLIIGDFDGLYFGNDTIIGGTGDDLLQGAAGADTFVFRPNDGNDEIAHYARDYSNHLNSTATASDFEVGHDTVSLLGFGYLDANDALANLSDVGGTAQFSDQGTTINFHGLTSADLSDPNLTVFVI